MSDHLVLYNTSIPDQNMRKCLHGLEENHTKKPHNTE
jgi:hypothetical protein